MKNYLFIIAFCLLNSLALADDITWMSKSDADKLMASLKNEKYVFYYCDNCEEAQGELVQVQSLSVEKATEGEENYGLKVKGLKLFKFQSDINGNFSKPVAINEEVNNWAYLNHTFAPKEGRGLPLGYLIGQSAEKLAACMDFIYFPHPEDTELFSSLMHTTTYSDYAAWHHTTIEPQLEMNDSFLGTFDVTFLCQTAGNCEPFPALLGTGKIAVFADGRVNLAVGKDKSNGTWKVERGKLIVRDNYRVTNVYGFRKTEDKMVILRNLQYHKPEGLNKEFRLFKLTKL